MAYKVTISDGSVLEKCIDNVTYYLNPLGDSVNLSRSTVRNSMIIFGMIDTDEKTDGLYKWALISGNNNEYKDITVEQYRAGKLLRKVRFTKHLWLTTQKIIIITKVSTFYNMYTAICRNRYRMYCSSGWKVSSIWRGLIVEEGVKEQGRLKSQIAPYYQRKQEVPKWDFLIKLQKWRVAG